MSITNADHNTSRKIIYMGSFTHPNSSEFMQWYFISHIQVSIQQNYDNHLLRSAILITRIMSLYRIGTPAISLYRYMTPVNGEIMRKPSNMIPSPWNIPSTALSPARARIWKNEGNQLKGFQEFKLNTLHIKRFPRAL